MLRLEPTALGEWIALPHQSSADPPPRGIDQAEAAAFVSKLASLTCTQPFLPIADYNSLAIKLVNGADIADSVTNIVDKHSQLPPCKAWIEPGSDALWLKTTGGWPSRYLLPMERLYDALYTLHVEQNHQREAEFLAEMAARWYEGVGKEVIEMFLEHCQYCKAGPAPSLVAVLDETEASASSMPSSSRSINADLHRPRRSAPATLPVLPPMLPSMVSIATSKKRSYEVEKKLEVVELITSKAMSITAASEHFGVDRSCIRQWLKREADLRQLIDSSVRGAKRKRLDGAGHPIVYGHRDEASPLKPSLGEPIAVVGSIDELESLRVALRLHKYKDDGHTIVYTCALRNDTTGGKCCYRAVGKRRASGEIHLYGRGEHGHPTQDAASAPPTAALPSGSNQFGHGEVGYPTPGTSQSMDINDILRYISEDTRMVR